VDSVEARLRAVEQLVTGAGAHSPERIDALPSEEPTDAVLARDQSLSAGPKRDIQ
jgi:hypothetical protein